MKKGHILLVEDNEGDILLTQEAFEHSSLVDKLSVVRNGKEAMDFLTKKENMPMKLHQILSCWMLIFPRKMGMKCYDLSKILKTSSIFLW
jgi:CheY-like chemotaxis protein